MSSRGATAHTDSQMRRKYLKGQNILPKQTRPMQNKQNKQAPFPTSRLETRQCGGGGGGGESSLFHGKSVRLSEIGLFTGESHTDPLRNFGRTYSVHQKRLAILTLDHVDTAQLLGKR